LWGWVGDLFCCDVLLIIIIIHATHDEADGYMVVCKSCKGRKYFTSAMFGKVEAIHCFADGPVTYDFLAQPKVSGL
jgi:hypothetical protein